MSAGRLLASLAHAQSQVELPCASVPSNWIGYCKSSPNDTNPLLTLRLQFRSPRKSANASCLANAAPTCCEKISWKRDIAYPPGNRRAQNADDRGTSLVSLLKRGKQSCFGRQPRMVPRPSLKSAEWGNKDIARKF